MYKLHYFLVSLLFICKIHLFLPVTYATDTEESICYNGTALEVQGEPISIDFNDSCSVQIYNYSIIARRDSSISEYLVFLNPPNDTVDEEIDPFREIKLNFLSEEESFTWTFKPKTTFTYFFHNQISHLNISFEITGNWSGYNVTFEPKEIPFITCSNEALIPVSTEPVSLPFNDSCNAQIYNFSIMAPINSSIIQILVTSNPSPDAIEHKINSFQKIVVKLLEKVKGKSNEWEILPKTAFRNIYYSKSSQLNISFKITGNWTGYNVTFTPKEIPFNTYYKNSSELESNIIKPWSLEEGRSYRPNSVYIFRIAETEDLNDIMITLHYLDIDEEEGEYLLIGPGSEPFESSPPVFISSISGSKNYLVNDNAAYIVFVTKSTKRNRKGFQAFWNYTGEQIEKPMIIEPDDIRQSVPICIFNITAAENEFQSKEAVNWFIDFRRSLARIASEFIKTQSQSFDENAEIVSESSVSVFGISRIIRVNESCQFISAVVKIYKESGKESAFTRKELEKILDLFIQSYAKSKDKFQFGMCPPLFRKTNWTAEIGYYLIVPVIFCLFLFAWTWKYNPVTKYLAKKKGMKRLSQHPETLKKYYEDEDTRDANNENTYTSLPNCQITDAQGRRYTLNLANTIIDGDLSDDEIFNKYRQRGNERRHTILPSQGNINQGFDLEEEEITNENSERNVQDVELEQKSDHVYESVNASSMQVDEEILDTKL